jgi:hypothetical protein
MMPVRAHLGPDMVVQPSCHASGNITYAEDTGEEVEAFPAPTNSMLVSGVLVARKQQGIVVGPDLMTARQFQDRLGCSMGQAFEVKYACGGT